MSWFALMDAQPMLLPIANLESLFSWDYFSEFLVFVKILDIHSQSFSLERKSMSPPHHLLLSSKAVIVKQGR